MRKVEAATIATSFSYLGGFVKYLDYGRTEVVGGRGAALGIDQDTYARATVAVQRLTAIANELEMPTAIAAGARAEETLLHRFRSHCGYDQESLAAISSAATYLISAFSD